MKRYLQTLFLITAILGSNGCATTGDPVIVNAQRSMEVAHELADSFLRWEFTNRAVLPPNITKVADKIRYEFPPALAIAKSTLESYKISKSQTDKDTLLIWLSTLRTLEEQIRIAYKP